MIFQKGGPQEHPCPGLYKGGLYKGTSKEWLQVTFNVPRAILMRWVTESQTNPIHLAVEVGKPRRQSKSKRRLIKSQSQQPMVSFQVRLQFVSSGWGPLQCLYPIIPLYGRSCTVIWLPLRMLGFCIQAWAVYWQGLASTTGMIHMQRVGASMTIHMFHDSKPFLGQLHDIDNRGS